MDFTKINDERFSKSSKFNTGVATTIRISTLWETINLLRQNPLAYDPQKSQFNYKTMINLYGSLAFEFQSKMNTEDRKKIKQIKQLITKLVQVKPPVKKNPQSPDKIEIMHSNWDMLSELLDLYEEKLRDLADSTGYGSPDKEDPRLALSVEED